MSDARFDEIMAELRRISLQVGDMDGAVHRLAGRMDRIEGRMGQLEGRMGQLEGRMGRLEGRMDRLGEGVDALQTTVRMAVSEYAEFWRRLHGASSALDVLDPEPGTGTQAQVDDLRQAMRDAAAELGELPPPPPPPPPSAEKAKPKLKVHPGGRTNPGKPRGPRKPRGKK